MSNVCKINVSLLKSYEKDFNGEMENFNNNTYNTFSSGYLNNCSDTYVCRMSKQLQDSYEKIKKGYSNVDKWWSDYNSNIEALENYLSENGNLGKITESSIRNCANNLPALENYNIDFAGIIPSSMINPSYSTTFVNNVSEVINTDSVFQIDNINYTTGAIVTNVEENLWSKFTDFFVNEKEWAKSKLVPFLYKVGDAVLNVLKSVAATLSTVVVSLIEGVLQFIEAIVDLIILVGAVIATVEVTIWIDSIGYILSNFTGKKYESFTAYVWNEIKAVVAKKFVVGWLDDFYENTDIGKEISERALGFDTVRSIFSGIGYVAGIVVLTIATAGAGTAGVAIGEGSGAAIAAASSTASAAASTASISATQLAVTAAAAGTGKGTQDAWAAGADTVEGLLSGILTGLWEGLQFYVGGKISTLNMAETKVGSKVLESVGTSGLKTKLLNSFSRVALDSADGGVEGLVKPAIESIYKDGYYDESGNYVEFLETENFFDRYNEIFEDNGGWSSVLTQAVIGGASSLIGELNFGKITNNIAIKEKVTDMIKQYDMPEYFVIQILENNGLIDAVDTSIDAKKIYQELLENNPDLILKALRDSRFKLSDIKSIKNAGITQIADEIGYVSKDLANELRELFFENDNIIGIHRTGGFDGRMIAEDGLDLTGHLGVEIAFSNIDLCRNITFFDKTEKGFANFIYSLKIACDYKTLNHKSDALIISIPKTAIDDGIVKDINILEPFKPPRIPKLKSEYIKGYIKSDHYNIIDYFSNLANKNG